MEVKKASWPSAPPPYLAPFSLARSLSLPRTPRGWWSLGRLPPPAASSATNPTAPSPLGPRLPSKGRPQPHGAARPDLASQSALQDVAGERPYLEQLVPDALREVVEEPLLRVVEGRVQVAELVARQEHPRIPVSPSLTILTHTPPSSHFSNDRGVVAARNGTNYFKKSLKTSLRSISSRSLHSRRRG